MSRLWNLETLDLSNCLELKELPRDIIKLVNLRHLINEECDSLVGMPYGLGLLTNLRTLSLFVVSKGNSSSSRKRKNGGIEELNGLNNLRGELKIKNLKYVENGSLANLKEKQFLRSLILNWGRSDGEEVEENDEVVLVGLEPNPNLKEITISSFLGVKMCNWLSFLPNLTSISIDKCRKCQYIPMLDQLPYLKSLSLRFLYDLEYISQEPSNNYSSTPSTTFFPSLEELTLYDCPKLEEWWRIDDDDRVGLPSFPCLSKLRIEYCPNLMSMPLYPSIEELTLSRTSSKPLGQTMMDALTSLMDLAIWSCPRLTQVHHGIRLDLLMDDMQSQSLRNLYSLKLYSLPKLASLPKGIQYLTSLQDLTVNECYQLELPENEDEDDMPWKGFGSLNSLELSGLPKLVSLPKGLQYLTSLQHLFIDGCGQLEFPNNEDEDEDDMPWQGLKSLHSLQLYSLPKPVSLPKGLQYVTTLQDLDIEKCHNLTDLLEWISNATSLSRLIIYKCPKSSTKCKYKMGVDWPKIAHIPTIRIDYEWVQEKCCYQLN
ncbi:hypothetical protein Pint_05357 [Pistacia integerrima]|uniref:Uncharacterized protein n=1 Tax=Pistacia integerrima TaxID=434235 RepID=A0ACC0Z5Y7_9ROSI|nr:hypothetical protein Pint_05357 [Pistacia integerrima]